MIRMACPDDISEIERIACRAYEKYLPRMEKLPAPMLADYSVLVVQRSVYVLEDGNQIKGFAVLLPEPDHMLLDTVAIDPSHQGKGLGRSLISFAEAESVRHGYDEVRLYTHVSMFENIRFYLGLGYREISRDEQEGYHRVFMSKRLDVP